MSNNQARIENAEQTLAHHTALIGGEGGNMSENLTDLLTDLMHMCREHNISFTHSLEMARVHEEAERHE